MRILFLTEPFRVEPLGIAYLSASLKKAGHETELLELNNNGWLDKLGEYRPDIVACSVTTGKHNKFLKAAKEIKERYRTFIVFGGSHPTYFPDVVNSVYVDAIVRGEAEKSFPRMIEDLQFKKCCKRVTDFRSLEQDLDRLPSPDREFLYKYPVNRNNPIKNVITSRGCAFSCPYCFNSIYRQFYKGQNWVRYRSAESVIRECQEVKKYPTKFIFFQDDEFLTNPNFEELMSQYYSRVNLPFHCQIRIEFLTDENANLLKCAGCTGVTFAVESGDEWIRKEVLKRSMTDAQIMKGVDLLRKYDLKMRTENMIGLPGENLNQMLATLELNARIHPTIAWASIFQPFPGLPLSEYARKNGFWDGQDAFKESFFEDTVLNTPIRKEIVNLQRLFGVACAYPIVKRYIKQLIRLPNNKAFDKIYAKYKQKRYDELFQ